jgi:hypothetical protein
MIMKVNIEEKDDTILVNVGVKPYHARNHNVKIRILHEDVMRYLSKQKIEVGRCIQHPPLVTNRGDYPQLSGEWIFEKPKPKKEVSTKKTPKKVKKTLDKPGERVIIEVQEKTLRRTEE